jgi:hypothetical protein
MKTMRTWLELLGIGVVAATVYAILQKLFDSFFLNEYEDGDPFGDV